MKNGIVLFGILFVSVLLSGCTNNAYLPLYAKSVNYSEVEPMLNVWRSGFNGEYMIAHTTDIRYKTNSMSSTFGVGNTLILDYNVEDVRVGDIIGFSNHTVFGNDGATHRVVRIDGGCIYTRGDGNFIEDGVCVEKEDVVFKVIGVIYTDG
jgi:hypothetical protein